MTGNVRMLLPMLGACFAATLFTTLLRNPPIYDSLKERAVQNVSAAAGPEGSAVVEDVR
jgi:H+/Cl- antiporter ClcA